MQFGDPSRYGRQGQRPDATPSRPTTREQNESRLPKLTMPFRVIAWVTLAAVPLQLFIRRFKPAGESPVTH